jgi:hypothetical protein
MEANREILPLPGAAMSGFTISSTAASLGAVTGDRFVRARVGEPWFSRHYGEHEEIIPHCQVRGFS